jgi:acyl-CoA reductase-like NAD-dependent aldehyde dehydrogenase
MTLLHEHDESLDRELSVAGSPRATGSWHEVRSPFSGEVVGRVAWASPELYAEAFDHAERAFAAGPPPLHERADLLARVAAEIAAAREQLAATICKEAGKPIAAARVEVDRAIGTFTAAATAARGLAGETVALDALPAGAGRLGMTVRVPAGVVAAITPFNFPLNLVAHKLAPAIAAGCPVVLKPADKTPLSALALGALIERAGLPAGMLSIVVGPPEPFAAEAVARDAVRVLTFTGSAAIGWRLRELAPRKKVLLELGGTSPAIVEPGTDLDAAADALCASAFGFAGQACVSLQRVLVHESVAEQLTERLVARAAALAVGDPAAEETDVGPVIDGRAAERILAILADARAAGAEVLVGGDADGSVIAPAVVAGVGTGMRIWDEELFGPAVGIATYATLDEAIELANDSRYGLQASIYTPRIADALRALERLDFGAVIVNGPPNFRTDQMPYGGVKESGNTREGPLHAIREMTEERLAVIG